MFKLKEVDLKSTGKTIYRLGRCNNVTMSSRSQNRSTRNVVRQKCQESIIRSFVIKQPLEYSNSHLILKSENVVYFQMSKLKKLNASRVDSMCDDVVSVISNLVFLALEYLKDITNEGVSAIVRNNPNLELLSVAECQFIDDNCT